MAKIENELDDTVDDNDAKDDYVEDVPIVAPLAKVIQCGKEVTELDDSVGHDYGKALEE